MRGPVMWDMFCNYSVSLNLESNDEAARQRRAAPGPKAPFALIASTLDSPRELEALLRWYGPVVVFPSLSHFCTARAGDERWAGVVVARACAFDPRLDVHVRERRCLALFGRALEREWPEGVRRLPSIEAAEAWLDELGSVLRESEPPRSEPLATASPTPHEPERGASMQKPVAKARARRLELCRGEYLLLGRSVESTHGLLSVLRRARNARHVETVSELPPELREARHWTGIVILHTLDSDALSLAKDPTLLGIWRAAEGALYPQAERSLDDEPGLLTFMAHTIAFEHTRSLSIARAIEHMTLEYGLSPQEAEVLTVATRTSALEERARLLSLSPQKTRIALKELCDAARGVPVAALVARVTQASSAR